MLPKRIEPTIDHQPATNDTYAHSTFHSFDEPQRKLPFRWAGWLIHTSACFGRGFYRRCDRFGGDAIERDRIRTLTN